MKKVLCFLLTFSVLLALSINITFAALTDTQCEKKNDGWYITGLPLINYTSDTGVGFGARLYFYNNGNRDADYFCEVPYLTQVYAQFYMTTTGYQYHELNWDQYNLFGTDLRLSTALVYERNINANYFGYGGRTTSGSLNYGGTSFSSYGSYYEHVLYPYTGPDNRGRVKYNNYIYTRPKLNVNLFGSIVDDVNYIVGVSAYWIGIQRWNDRKSKVNGNYHTSTETLIVNERPPGFEGGWNNTFRVGIAWNTIDYEPDPTGGFNIDYSLEAGQKWLGSSFAYWKHTVGARFFYTILDQITFATRIGYTASAFNIPFFEMSEFGFPYGRESGLGGNRTLRGYKSDRFIGKTMTLAQLEVRWAFAEITPFGQRFGFKLVAFVDTGNAYDNADDPFASPRWNDYRTSYGGGLVIAWNQATIIHFYYAQSREDSSISVDFSHAIK